MVNEQQAYKRRGSYEAQACKIMILIVLDIDADGD